MATRTPAERSRFPVEARVADESLPAWPTPRSSVDWPAAMPLFLPLPLRPLLREEPLSARVGLDEFFVVLTESHLAAGLAVGEVTPLETLYPIAWRAEDDGAVVQLAAVPHLGPRRVRVHIHEVMHAVGVL